VPELKIKLLSFALLLIAFCLITPCAAANAEITHVKETTTDNETSTITEDLDPSYFPYTQVKVAVTETVTTIIMYNQVVDGKGILHLNGKVLARGTVYGEVWFWDDTSQVWVLGQKTSYLSKMILGINQLSLDSEVHTSTETRFLSTIIKSTGIDPQTGEPFTVKALIVDHLIFKLVNGELQFEKSWEITRTI
jgi:hypothetical protein